MQTGNILTKLKVLIVLPLIVILIGLIVFIVKSNTILTQMNTLQYEILQIRNTSDLINELQKERGISSGYLGSKGSSFKEKLLLQQKSTDQAFSTFLNTQKIKQSMYLKKKQELTTVRESIYNQSISNIKAFDLYSKRIKTMLDNYLKIIMKLEDIRIKNHLQGYINLSLMKESLGRIRGAFNGIFSIGKVDKKLLYRVIYAKGIHDSAERRFFIIASPNIVSSYQALTASPEYHTIEKQIQRYSQKNLEHIDIDPYVWWEMMTEIIEKHHLLEQHYFSIINHEVEQKAKEIKIKIVLNGFIFLILSIIVLWLGLKIRNSILRNISLLNEYKDAVDRSSIVSKTDKQGIITYANKQFCDITGYTLNELLGKSHNIIRHKDMPKKVFSELWSQILQKKPWSGIVKNRKKDGSFYIVKATISPILNHKGEIEEFISIRNDITKNITLQQEIEEMQKELIFKMGEVVEQRSVETGYHVRRVAEYSKLLATYYGLSSREIDYLSLASPMHDIGKVGIPDTILHKPESLTSKEWEIMKTHAEIGYKLFRESDKPLLKSVAIIAYEHHEKYDGTGYPRGLKGDEIHIYGRITALADVFDAIGSDRCYKKAWKDEKIFSYIKKERGLHFDPDLVDIFFAHIDEFKKIRERFKDTCNLPTIDGKEVR